ncbi:MAG TPA: DNA repair protein RadC [Thermoanaerobaculia bacterium]|nr:DNA repair protein RadC [Thermoanaerobaculia bacterium]
MTDLIADMPMDERPRERMLMHGTRTLSDAELLALLIGTGTRGRSAVQVARELLGDGIGQLGRLDVTELARVPGVGTAKATRIAAAFELSRRTARDCEGTKYEPSEFGEHLIRTHQFHQEHVGAALLDSHDRIVKRQTVFMGTINTAFVSTREIVRFAVLNNAAGVVLYHNHPGGNPTPSAQDLNFTTKLRDALDLVDIELVDHVIAGSAKYYSLQEWMCREAVSPSPKPASASRRSARRTPA